MIYIISLYRGGDSKVYPSIPNLDWMILDAHPRSEADCPHPLGIEQT